MTYSFILVNWNGARDTIECVDSLCAMDFKDFHIYIVDCASAIEDYQRLVNRLQDNSLVTLIRSEENLGFSGGNNVGIKRALADGASFVILLNNDTVVRPSFLRLLDDARRIHPEYVLWGCKTFYGDGKHIYTRGGGKNNLFFAHDTRIDAGKLDASGRDEKVRLGYIAGSCLGAESKVFSRIGYLDDDYFLYSEETDFCHRARKAGFLLGYCAQAVLDHKVAQSTGYRSPTYVYYFLRNKLLFMKKNGRWYHWPTFLVVYCLMYLGGFFVLLMFRKPSTARFIWYAVKDFFAGRFGRSPRFS